jgi:hypothetical protein
MNKMSMMRAQHRAAAVVPLVVGLVAGCAAAMAQPVVAGHPARATNATGKVTGHLIMEGGAIQPGQNQPPVRSIPGTVTFTETGHRPASIQVGNSGKFSVRLAAGRYKVSAKSPWIIGVNNNGRDVELPCSQPLSVTVKAGHSAAITVACIVP